MHRITIERLANGDNSQPDMKYEALVESIDLPKIIQAINTPPRPPRVRRKRGQPEGKVTP